MPRNVQLTVDRYLVDKASPGTRVTVIGVYMIPQGRKKQGGKGGGEAKAPYLRVVGMQMDREGAGRWKAQFTPEEEEQFMRLSRRGSIRKRGVKDLSFFIFFLHREFARFDCKLDCSCNSRARGH
jgi:DNA replication licensing factor MCM5